MNEYITVKLQPPMLFNIVWLLLGLFLLALAVLCIVVLVKVRPSSADPNLRKLPVVSGPGFYALKRQYVNKIDKLLTKRMKNRITLRDAYQELSTIARSYVQQVTGINTLKMSLSELRIEEKNQPNIAKLSVLVNDYYEPEFAKWSDADFRESCNLTRRMIEQWL
ncbi:MAG: hypothetical protein K6F53_11705 [Lachnospiraceae bacterium]|nr:hypothetical protein [Lachnospiraceae bacterium]